MRILKIHQTIFRLSIFFLIAQLVSLPGFSQQFKKELTPDGNFVFASASMPKVQQLYTAQDLGFPTTGVLSKIYFKKGNSAVTSFTLTNFQIKVGLTSAQSLPSVTTFSTNLTTVLRRTSYTITAPAANSFFAIDIDPVFEYQAGQSLIVEYSCSGAGTPALGVLYSNGPTGLTTKRINATSTEAATGTQSNAWTDFGFDLTSTLTAPSHDNCSGAITLKPATVLSPYTSHNVGATQSIAPIVCEGTISPSANDVWFTTFFVTANDSIIVQGLGGFDPVVELFSGTCELYTSLACSDDPVNANAPEIISTGNVTTGTYYRIRVYGAGGSQGSFKIGIKSPIAFPGSNDNCNSLIRLQSTTNYNFGVSPSSTRGKNQTYPPKICDGQTSPGAAYDAWFSFTCFQSNDSIILIPELDFKPVIELYSQACSPAATITCAQNSFIPGGKVVLAPGNLTPGATYVFRVYGWDGLQGDFNICVKRTPSTSMPNDECRNAIALTPANSCNAIAGTTLGANQSMLAGCEIATNLPENDVWYKFVALSTSDTVVVTPTGSFNPIVELFSGCAQSFHFKCSNSADENVTEKVGGGLVVGQTYYARIHGWTTTDGPFTICVKTNAVVVTPPANDECSTAIPLTVNNVCTPVTGTNTNATQSLAPISCSGFISNQARDVWYSFVASQATDSIIVDPQASFDAVVQLFTATCNSLVPVLCSDNPTNSLATETIAPGNLTPGQTYFVRVYGWQTSQGNFDICVRKVNCSSQAGIATTSVNQTVANSAIIANLVGYSGSAKWYATYNPQVWMYMGFASPPDTFLVLQPSADTLYLRAKVTTGTCLPAYSTQAIVRVRCATNITQRNGGISGHFISNVQIGNTLNNTSTFDPLGGAYQDFSHISGTLCKGQTYPFSVSPSSSASLYKSIWIDFNNDGDFGDPGESVFGPAANTGVATGSFLIPLATVPNSVRMRVMLFSTDAAGFSADPCFTGPYPTGEIEEYTLNLFDAPSVSNAGPDQSVCSKSASLNALPSPVGTGIWTLISGSGSISSSTSPNTTVTNLGKGANVFRWSVSTPCSTAVDDVTIINTQPVVNAGADISFDQSSGNKNLGSGIPAGGTWSGSGVSGMIFNTIQSSGVYPVLYCYTDEQQCQACDTLLVTIKPPVGKCDIPIITPGSGTYTSTQTVTIFTKTPGAQIYYTLTGNNPSVGTGFTKLYSGPFQLTNTVNIRAMAVKSGLLNSANSSVYYTIPTTANPVISPGTGVYAGNQNLILTCATAGASIYYTLNGNLPRFDIPNSYTKLYTGPVIITGTVTVWAVAKHPDLQYSGNVSATISIPPVRFNPPAGTYELAQTVTMTNTTLGAQIYYTTNGQVPVPGNAGTTPYTGPVFVPQSGTLKAISWKNNGQDGLVASANYLINTPSVVANPIFTPGAGICAAPCAVTITCSTAGADIFYTTNGNTPTQTVSSTNKKYSGPVVLTGAATLKARAFFGSYIPSAVVTGVYSLGAIAREAVAEEKLELVSGAELHLYPNPTSGLFTLEGFTRGTIYTISLWSTAGQEVWKQTIVAQDEKATMPDIQPLPKGLYTVQIQAADTRTILRLVKE